MPQKYTEARKNGNRKWDAENLDRLSISMPRGGKDAIKAHTARTGETVNRFINRAISAQIDRDNAGQD